MKPCQLAYYNGPNIEFLDFYIYSYVDVSRARQAIQARRFGSLTEDEIFLASWNHAGSTPGALVTQPFLIKPPSDPYYYLPNQWEFTDSITVGDRNGLLAMGVL